MIAASTGPARRDVALAWMVIAGSALLILVTVAVIAAALSRWVVRPLTALSSRVCIRSGTNSTTKCRSKGLEVEPHPYDEAAGVRELSGAFDAMAEDVGSATTAQRRLVADTAHALRNPLAALRIRLDILGMRVPDSAAPAHLKTTMEVDRLTTASSRSLVLAAAETPAHTQSASGCTTWARR